MCQSQWQTTVKVAILKLKRLKLKALSYKHNTGNWAVPASLSTPLAQSVGSFLMKIRQLICHTKPVNSVLKDKSCSIIAFIDLHCIKNLQQLAIYSCSLFLRITQLHARALTSGHFWSDLDIFTLAGRVLLTTAALEQQTPQTAIRT